VALKKFLDLGSPPPFRDAVTAVGGMLSRSWLEWFARLVSTLASIPNVVNGTVLEDQGASISATDFSGTFIPAGLYRASYRIRVSRAAGVSSSLTVTLAWTGDSVAQSFTGAALTGNTTATYQQGTVILRSDADALVTFAVTYGSVGAPTMQYEIDVFLEKLRG